MTVATLNDEAIVKGTIRIPRFGVWTADLTVDHDAEFEGSLTLLFGDDVEMICAVERQEAIYGKNVIRLVGGNGGMKKLVTAKHYTGPTIGAVLADVLTDAGESVSLEAERDALDVPLEHWTSIPIPAGRMITELVKHAAEGTVWRVRPDGLLWIGVDTFEDSGLEEIFDNSRSGADGSIELAADFPSLQPGISIKEEEKDDASRQVDYIEHHITPDKIRTMVWFRDENGVSTRDRIKEAQYAVARAALPVPEYAAIYQCQLVKQPSDFLIDANPLAPLDQIIPPLSNIPLHLGIPGAIVRVKPGATLLIGWEDKDPARPYAALWAKGAKPTDIALVVDKLQLGADVLNVIQAGVINGEAIDPFTSKFQWQLGNASRVVFAKK